MPEFNPIDVVVVLPYPGRVEPRVSDVLVSAVVEPGPAGVDSEGGVVVVPSV